MQNKILYFIFFTIKNTVMQKIRTKIVSGGIHDPFAISLQKTISGGFSGGTKVLSKSCGSTEGPGAWTY
jgi:hypothetical protein